MLLTSLVDKEILEEKKSISSALKELRGTLSSIGHQSLDKYAIGQSACAQSFVVITLAVITMNLIALLYLCLLDLVASEAHHSCSWILNLSLLSSPNYVCMSTSPHTNTTSISPHGFSFTNSSNPLSIFSSPFFVNKSATSPKSASLLVAPAG